MSEPSQYMVNVPSSVPARTQAPCSHFAWDRLERGQTLVLFALGACWFLFFNELRVEWQVNPQYSYGYLVPLLGAALLWRRWPDRPAACPRQIPVLSGVIAGLFLLQLPLNIFL